MTINDVRADLDDLLEQISKKFNITPLVNTDYRQDMTYGELNGLGDIKYWYTVSSFTLDNNPHYDTEAKEYYYNGYFDVIIETQNENPEQALDDLLMFLSNETSTNLYLMYKFKKTPIKIRGARKLDDRRFNVNNNTYFKKVISFKVYYEFKTEGGYYKWQ